MAYNPNFRGTSAKGSATAISSAYTNGEAFSLTQGQPVSVNSSGQMVHVDVTSDSSVAGLLGVCGTLTPSAASGQVFDAGRLENVSIVEPVGTALWVNFDGSLTTTRPDLSQSGWSSGMYVIFVGVVVKNQFIPGNLDIALFMDVVGVL